MAKTKKAQKEDKNENAVSVNATETRLLLAKKLLANARETLERLENLLTSDSETASAAELLTRHATPQGEFLGPQLEGRIVEGVFDGQHMVGSDGQQYLVPQNYASKSKLVEGDILKLTIQGNGGFVFKQIGPIERERVVGMLVRDENTQGWKGVAEGKKYSLLPASVSYFKGQPGDSIVLLIPKSAPSRWAAVENVIKQE